jgi:hypothetical protein
MSAFTAKFFVVHLALLRLTATMAVGQDNTIPVSAPTKEGVTT